MNTYLARTGISLCIALLLPAVWAQNAPPVAAPNTATGAGITVDMGLTRLQLDAHGRLAALVDTASGRDMARKGSDFCRLQTEAGYLLPESATQAGDTVTFTFPGGITLVYRVTPGAGFSVWEVSDLKGLDMAKLESVRLCDLNVTGLPTLRTQLNAVASDENTVAVLATHINVHAVSVAGTNRGSNKQGVTHSFVRDRQQIKSGLQAARFTATSSLTTNDGYAMRGRALRTTQDLTGLKTIKLWVHGDGRGESLKVQLFDGKGGYRDDYIPITFTGWQEVVCEKPGLSTLDAAHVTHINFYYNSMPANQTVECCLDDVRAVLDTPQGVREVVLEDFEDPACDLWDAEGAFLRVETLKRYGILPAGFGIVACPNARLPEAMEAFQRAAGLPSPHPGGTWNKTSPWTKRSYLFITSFAEKDQDETIQWAQRGGFPMCLICDGSWNLNRGHYDINTVNFPDGLPALQRTAEKFRAAGIRVGMHFLAPSVYPQDPYVRPKPDPRLFKDARVPLAADVDAKVDFIPTDGPPPKEFPAEDGGYTGNGTFLQIDDELIQYGELRTEPPYGFGACTRGANQTVATAHAKDAAAQHLLRSYGYFLFDLDTTLADEVTGHVARTANAIKADMLYFDGSERLQGDHWYYNAKLHNLYYTKLDNKDTLLQGSSCSHFSWHVIARNASADGHGDVKGYLDERLPTLKWFENNLMPIDMGWYYVYAPEVTADQYDYILQKCLGFNASISVQTNPACLRTHPEMGPIFDLVNTYERLRLSGLVPAEVSKLLREPKREYRLLRSPLRLRRTVFGPWTDFAGDGAASMTFDIEPAAPGTRLGLQLRCGGLAAPGPAYRAADAVVLESFDDLAPYVGDPKNESAKIAVGQGGYAATSPGVTQEFTLVEGGKDGGKCASYTASGAGGWSCIGRRFDPPLDISKHQGIGLWLKGDGNGGKFKLQLRQDGNATDYYINNDFSEWRYIQLLRPEKPQPHVVDYAKIDYLLFYFNVLPAKTTVTCLIDDVKALMRLDEGTVESPELRVGERASAFPAVLKSGERLVYFPGEVPYVVPKDQGARRTLPAVADLAVEAKLSATVRLPAAPTGKASFRWVLDSPEELPLPDAALQTPLPAL
ncbi:MAG: hypothetical protein A3K19_25155 [Lentisphaerae bacterium RIFOXYB12_FULL_65_16]|nr:MAG: hypothetical protein A3K18_00750 [Lentisphaerae bacterium RIFOXYA12_64_32]OGV91034.1 MAG: hypothetical protein A3K19_25155 [Lentisphaerae bacterium RIFOXYB12_FULL_65_16]